MAILEVKNISKSFDSLRVLKDISFNVEVGEVVAIIGPSGSGKSTLLRCINQLEKADGGEINVDGVNMFHTENGKAVYAPSKTLRDIRLKIGLVFQNFNLFPHFSVEQNIIEAPVHVLKQSKAEARANCEELLKKMGLETKGKSYPCELSGGQQQRCAIARALIKNPKLLLCDEPTGALDSKTSRDILILLEKINAKYGTTMLIVTHNNAIKNMVHKVIIVKDGLIKKDYLNETRIPAAELEDL